MKDKLLVYTAVYGVPDVVMEPSVISPQCDYRLYTDLLFAGRSRYEVVIREASILDARRAQRWVKILGPEDWEAYEGSLYLDSTVQLKADPTLFLDLLEPGSDIMLFRHYKRDCLYDEADVVVERGLDDRETVGQQVMDYREAGYPPHNGLWAGTVVLRRHTEAMREFSREWWREVAWRSSRDQISLSFVLWALGVKVTPFPSQVWWGNPWFRWELHDHKYNRFRKPSGVRVSVS